MTDKDISDWLKAQNSVVINELDPALDAFNNAYKQGKTPDTPSAHSQPYFKRCVNSNCKQANYDYAKSCYKCGTPIALHL